MSAPRPPPRTAGQGNSGGLRQPAGLVGHPARGSGRLFGGSAGVATADSGTSTTVTPPTAKGGTTAVTPSTPALKAALGAIQKAYSDGQAALKKGDFTAYGEAQKRLQAAIADAVAAAPTGSVTLPAPAGSKTTPAPTPSATAKP